ncbi:hypothetical protein GCK32_004835 [Trichostrongylus colubriformis]|uniref:PTHB1 N-terminal domain-containing protein n=1 Tax=Trichostrongylus colubriformis TaxID=6319 RepID=A0AAN8F972_TRICO
MVELGSRSPFGQTFDNSVFIVPAIIIIAIVDQLLIGGEDGVLTIVDPGGSEKHPILLEQPIGRSIIDIAIGDFLPAAGSVLAVLTPYTLSFFKLSYSKSLYELV